MIDEIRVFEKIDEMKSKALKLVVKEPCDRLDEIQNDISNGYIAACDEFIKIIKSEQIEIRNFDVVSESIDRLTKDRDFYKSESIKDKAKLGEIRILMDNTIVKPLRTEEDFCIEEQNEILRKENAELKNNIAIANKEIGKLKSEISWSRYPDTMGK